MGNIPWQTRGFSDVTHQASSRIRNDTQRAPEGFRCWLHLVTDTGLPDGAD
jgi:hypothetical protein